MKKSALIGICILGLSACTGNGSSTRGQTEDMVGQGSNSSQPAATDANGMGYGAVKVDKQDAPGMPNAQVSPDQNATTSGTSSGTQLVPKPDENAAMKKKLDASRPGTSKDL